MPVVTSGATTVGAVQISGLSPTFSPIESWPNGILTGKAYGVSAVCNAVAAQNSYAELRNPTGSGKNLWIYEVSYTPAAAGQVYLSRTSPPNLATGGQCVNLLTGLINSVAFIANSSSASIPGAAFVLYNVAANVLSSPPTTWACVVPPNAGFVTTLNLANTAVTVTLRWLEV